MFRCSVKKLGSVPQYDFNETGPANARIFECKVSICDLKASVSATTKKNAKNLAAEQLYKLMINHQFEVECWFFSNEFKIGKIVRLFFEESTTFLKILSKM